ncbi:hypothetical protein BH09BAC3_BH09BAC3_10880 [soil metagenome]
MKKIVMLLCASFIVLAASAQIEKGTILAGASSNLGFNSYNPSGSNSTSTTVFNLDVKGGYFFIDNLAGGIKLGFNRVSTGGTSYGTTTVGVFGRYYVQGKFFLGAGINSVSPSSGSSSIEVPLEAGYAAFINKNIAVEPALNFTKYDGGSVFGLNVGFTLYLNRN